MSEHEQASLEMAPGQRSSARDHTQFSPPASADETIRERERRGCQKEVYGEERLDRSGWVVTVEIAKEKRQHNTTNDAEGEDKEETSFQAGGEHKDHRTHPGGDLTGCRRREGAGKTKPLERIRSKPQLHLMTINTLLLEKKRVENMSVSSRILDERASLTAPVTLYGLTPCGLTVILNPFQTPRVSCWLILTTGTETSALCHGDFDCLFFLFMIFF